MVTATKSNNHRVGFGAQAERFGRITVHPNLDPSGLYAERPDGCDPCLYQPQPLKVIFEVNRYRKVDKDPWRYKIELEEWARNLGYRNQKILEKRRWEQTLLGPAWLEIEELPLGGSRCQPACNNVGFGRTPRFKPSKNCNPGPGTHYRANPYKAPHGPHSTRQTFQREDPCRFKDESRKWLLAPNRYLMLDKESIEQKPNKLVSLRGPYELFSGRRDASVKNHFQTSKCSAATWPIALKGSLETFKKTRLGVMNKTGRDSPYRGRNALVDINMCLRRPEEPGPGYYEAVEPQKLAQNKWPFNSSYDKGPGYRRAAVWPGVGRYNAAGPAPLAPCNGHRHVFLSKQGRTNGAVISKPMNTF